MPKFLTAIDRVMDVFEKYIVGFATIAIAIIMFINVILRNFAGGGLAWAFEASSYLNMVAVFIAAGAGFKYGTHVGVSVVVDYVIPKKLHKFSTLITQLLILAFTVMFCAFAFKMAVYQLAQNQLSSTMRMPIGYLYGVIGVGMADGAIRVIMEIVKLFYPHKEELKPEGGAAAC
ncbi:MAG: TRAP transporter small permease [Oscillospiraceae bacterium]|nr:TRAP transporter small permease [Oscillospiraceae bacterium]